jgi:hypothetical protein
VKIRLLNVALTRAQVSASLKRIGTHKARNIDGFDINIATKIPAIDELDVQPLS